MLWETHRKVRLAADPSPFARGLRFALDDEVEKRRTPTLPSGRWSKKRFIQSGYAKWILNVLPSF
jgi:hypothetical protein